MARSVDLKKVNLCCFMYVFCLFALKSMHEIKIILESYNITQNSDVKRYLVWLALERSMC